MAQICTMNESYDVGVATQAQFLDVNSLSLWTSLGSFFNVPRQATGLSAHEEF